MNTAVIERPETTGKFQLRKSRYAKIVIRQADEADVEAMAQIYNHYVLTSTVNIDASPESPDQRSVWLREQNEQGLPVFVMVASEKDSGWEKVIGFASLAPYSTRVGRKTVEASMYFSGDRFGSDFGPQLITHLINVAKVRGYRSMVFITCTENLPGIKLAKEYGFDIAGRLQEVGCKFGRWLDICIMQKIL